MDLKRFSLMGLIAVFLLSAVCGVLYAAEDEADAQESWSVTVTPVGYTTVKGDVNKFRAIQWLDEGYYGGIKEFIYMREEDDGALMRFEGSAIPTESNGEAKLFYQKEGLGEADIHYNLFRKYYDDSGGFYYPNTTLRSVDSGEDLKLDIGHLSIEISPDLENLHDITFLYERHTKDGKKSRLTWAEARESARPSIAPSWQSIDEEVNIFALKGKTELAGVNLKAEQRYEKAESHNIRHERWVSTTASASHKKQRVQDQRPESEVLTTILSGDKWFNKEKSYVNVAYRYNKITNHELESISETNAAGNPFNYGTHAKTRVNAMADNELDDHVLIGHYSTNISPQLNVAAKFKGEVIIRDAQSTYPYDDSPGNDEPDGIIDEIDYNQTKNKARRFGQNFSFRYTGIKNTSLYGDVEVGEVDNNLLEIQRDINRNFVWIRETDVKTKKTVWTLGTRTVPSRYFNMTAQFRRRLENNDYDDQQDRPAGEINSAFFDQLKLTSNEFTTRLTWKPTRWLRGSFRYQLVGMKFDARAENRPNAESRTNSQIFTYDVVLMPLDELLLNLAFVQEDVKTSTPTTAYDNFPHPGFNGDVNSIILSASYTPTAELSYTGVFVYSYSDNFDDFTSIAPPYGVDNSRKTVELSMRYTPKDKSWTLEPHYAFYSHNTGSLSEFGNYNAHVAWLDVTREW